MRCGGDWEGCGRGVKEVKVLKEQRKGRKRARDEDTIYIIPSLPFEFQQA